jgi:D-alanine-D-alanine ligase
MKIGLTFDLRSAYLAEGYTLEETAEFDRDDTIDAIENALLELGFNTDRIGHARNLIQRLAAGDRWDLVFNISEGMHGLGREAQVPAILDVYQIPYTFAGPLMMSLCLHKGHTKTIVKEGGVPTAKYFVAETMEQLNAWKPPFGFPMFVKPVAEGTGKGVTPKSQVLNRKQLLQVGAELLHEFHQPILIEQFLSGREFTVGIWGNGDLAQVIGTFEIVMLAHADQSVYSYTNKENSEELVEYRAVYPNDDEEVKAAEQVALAAWRMLDGVDAGRIDIRSDANNRPQFIEVNPLAGLHPTHSDLPMICYAFGHSFRDLIDRIVSSAMERANLIPPARLIPLAEQPFESMNGNAADRKRIVILHQQTAEDSLAAETDVLDQMAAVQQSLRRMGHEVRSIACTMDLERLPERLMSERTDLVFNLVESLGGTDRLMAMVPELLDRHAIPYTGSSTRALQITTNKIATKQALTLAGLPTPAWFCPMRRSENGLLASSVPSKSPRLHKTILKAIWEHASFALDDSAIVESDGSRTSLKSLIQNRQAQIGCPCFAEEYIDGREFNVSLIGRQRQPYPLPPAEIEFHGFAANQPRIVGYKAKWDANSFEYQHTPRRFDFPSYDRRLLKELVDLSIRCWEVFDLSGYARVDFRIDRLGRPWILEINANPCLTPDAGFAAALARAGIDFDTAVGRIIDDALSSNAVLPASVATPSLAAGTAVA